MKYSVSILAALAVAGCVTTPADKTPSPAAATAAADRVAAKKTPVKKATLPKPAAMPKPAASVKKPGAAAKKTAASAKKTARQVATAPAAALKKTSQAVTKTAQAAVKAVPKPIKHVAVGARVKASSTHIEWEGEGPAGRLVDGDLATRWSSDYADDQQVLVEMAKPLPIVKVRLHWENAVATRYEVMVSPDGKSWDKLAEHKDSKVGPRVDEFEIEADAIKAIKLELHDRVKPEWGFSIYEIEAVPASE